MNYLFLVYSDKERLEAMPAGGRDAFESACRVNDEMLRQNGRLLAIEDLRNSHTAAAVHLWNGKVSVTDIPFTRTNEQLISLFFINARDLNEAIQVASHMPQARGGPIEVRPIAEFDQR